MSEIIFADGISFYPPNQKAPDFVKGSIVVKVDKFIEFAQKHKRASGDLRLTVKLSKGGKEYIALDTYEPNNQTTQRAPAPAKQTDSNEIAYPEDEINPDDIPF